jgi:DNA-binding LacI/PurR family transcriptional regulator
MIRYQPRQALDRTARGVGALTLTRRRRRTTIQDVARLAGVSNGAVSLALSGKAGVAQSTRERIIAAADELAWRPSIGARALLSSRAFAVGLILARDPELLGADPFFPSFIAGVESELAQRNYALVLQVVRDEPRAEAEAYRRLAQEGRVDGVFLTDLHRHDRRIPLVQELHLRAVAVGSPNPAAPIPSVAIDDRVGVGEAVRHLLSLGHDRIAFVGGTPGYVHSASRLAAWRQALRQAGVAPGPVVTADFTGKGGAAATARLLDGTDRPTAIVYANDLMAIAGMSVAGQRGVDIPGQLSVVGFDDIPLAAHLHPPLTTVRQDVLDWGRASAAALLSRIEDREIAAAGLPPSRLVLRATTAPPARRDGRAE